MAFFTARNSTSARLDFGRNAWLDWSATKLTAFGWGKLNSLTAANAATLVSKLDSFHGGVGFFSFAFTNDGVGTGNNFSFVNHHYGANPGWDWDGPQDFNWHSHAVTYDFANPTTAPVYYMDGVAKGVVGSFNQTFGSTGTDTSHVYIGNNGTTDNDSWGGSIAHVAIWNATLSPTEVSLLAFGVSPPLIRSDALVFYCPCSGDPKQALDLGRARLGIASVTGTWMPADDPYGLAGPKGDMSAAFSPVFLPLPYRRPNQPLYRR